MNLLSILLQAAPEAVSDTTNMVMTNQTYFNLLLKGGLILIPLLYDLLGRKSSFPAFLNKLNKQIEKMILVV